MGEEPIYTAEQVREMLKLRTVRTVHRLIKRGELNAFTVGRDYRIRKSALEQFTQNRAKRSIEDEDREVQEVRA